MITVAMNDAVGEALDPQLRQSCAALQRERDQLAADLAPFTREFFEEIEDLKYNYSVALQRVDEYARRFGALEGASR